MTPELQRIYLAEFEGYIFVPSHDEFGRAIPDCWKGPDGDHFWFEELPDYLNDLNA